MKKTHVLLKVLNLFSSNFLPYSYIKIFFIKILQEILSSIACFLLFTAKGSVPVCLCLRRNRIRFSEKKFVPVWEIYVVQNLCFYLLSPSQHATDHTIYPP